LFQTAASLVVVEELKAAVKTDSEHGKKLKTKVPVADEYDDDHDDDDDDGDSSAS
jgi:hypothetical protein